MGAAQTPFPIVGIGASAGGVEALEGFFRDVPPGSGCAFVVVTHLNRDRPSLPPQIIARYTDMPAHVADDDVEVAENEIYVMPSDSRSSTDGCASRSWVPAVATASRSTSS